MEEFCRNFGDLPDVRSDYDDFQAWMPDSELNELWGGNMLIEPTFDNRSQPNINGLNANECGPASTEQMCLNSALGPQNSNDSLRLFCENSAEKNGDSSLFAYSLGGGEGHFPKDFELASIETVEGMKLPNQAKEVDDSLGVPPLFISLPSSDISTPVLGEVKTEKAASQPHLIKLKSLDVMETFFPLSPNHSMPFSIWQSIL